MPDASAGPVVISAFDVVPFTPEGSPRTYHLAPLTYRQRGQFRREVRQVAGEGADRALFLAAIRDAVTRAEPSNVDQLLATIDTAINDPADQVAASQVRLIETTVDDDPHYQRLVERQQRWQDEMPLIAARWSLRGWSGPGLPPFPGGAVPLDETVLDHIPAAEVSAIGNQAYLMTILTTAALGNSEAPSPAPATLDTSPAA